MVLTAIGFVTIISAFIFLIKKKNLALLALIAAPLQSASVVNFSGPLIGISPFYFILLLICAQLFISKIISIKKRKILLLKYKDPIARLYLLSLNIFFLVASLSLFLPFVFEGLLVYVPRMGLEDKLGSLSFSFSNIAQLGYLFLNILFTRQIYLYSKKNGINPYFKIIYGITAASVLIGAWELSGVYYSRHFFANNITANLDATVNYAIIDRVALTFTEPSTAATFLAPLSIMFLFSVLSESKNVLINLLLFILTFTLLFLTFSTTAYASFLIGIFPLFICLVFAKNGDNSKSNNYAAIARNIIIVFCLALPFCFLVAHPDKFGFAFDAINDVLLDKHKSLSAEYRSNSNSYTYELLWRTFGLGVGIGSNRPSSFLAYLASNLGLLGVLFYVENIVLALICFVSSLRLENNLSSLKFLLLWVVNFIAMTLAVPDLSWPYFWILTGFLLSIRKSFDRQSTIVL